MLWFDWDDAKEAQNVRRHGVDFYEASVALHDHFAVGWFDAGHSMQEWRHITIGFGLQDRLLAVITSEGWPRPRIISARRATKRERHAYEQQRPPDTR